MTNLNELKALANELDVDVDIEAAGREGFVMDFVGDRSELESASTFEDACNVIRNYAR